MSSKPFFTKWMKYLFTQDKISQGLFGTSIAAGLIWHFAGKNETVGLIAAGGFLLSVLVSVILYAVVGQTQEKSIKKFYDAIYNDCDWPGSYSGRRLNRIKVSWNFIWAKAVTIHAEGNSRVGTSDSGWRTVKLSVEDSFLKRGQHLVTSFSPSNPGVLTFTVHDDNEVQNPEVQQEILKEGLYSYAYDTLSSYGHPLPRVTSFKSAIDSKGAMSLDSTRIEFFTQQESYNRKSFETNFRQKYEYPNVIWMFKWDYSSVEISKIERGSVQERQLQGNRSVKELVKASIGSAFLDHSENSYIFTPEMISWSGDGKRVDSLTIDFLQSDVSRPDRVQRFEALIRQGLMQLFKESHWRFDWNVDAFEKTLTINRV